MASELPHSVADVRHDHIEPGAMATASHVFLGLFHSSQLEQGQTTGLGGRRSVADFFGGRHVDERLQLVVQILLGSIPTRDPADDGREAVQERHAPSRTLVTANDTRFQRSRCCSSCRRPEAVRR